MYHVKSEKMKTITTLINYTISSFMFIWTLCKHQIMAINNMHLRDNMIMKNIYMQD